MSRSIKTYDDLLMEEQRLQQQIKVHEALLREDIVGIREGLQPVSKVFSFLQKMSTRDHTSAIANFGIDFSIDLLVRRLILARAGWFTKILVPFVMKNFSSHIINEEQRTNLTKKVQNLFNKIRPGKKNAAGYNPN